MAGEIAGSDSAMPEARNQQNKGNDRDPRPGLAQEPNCGRNGRGRFCVDGHFLAYGSLLTRAGASAQSSTVACSRSRGLAWKCMDAGGKNYFEGWLSPKRLRRSRKRRCKGVGVLGLKATKYHKGCVRSRLSQVSVGASVLGCRATFSRMAP